MPPRSRPDTRFIPTGGLVDSSVIALGAKQFCLIGQERFETGYSASRGIRPDEKNFCRYSFR